MTPENVLDFWFCELSWDDWFRQSDATDAEVTRRFRDLHLELARRCDGRWLDEPAAALAAILVFDQFPRNMYRASPLAFSTDCLALALAERALSLGYDEAVPADQRAFFYMPFEHSERLEDQDRAVALFSALGDPLYLDFAERHRQVIRQFGRFPHRNRFLMRVSTPEEEAYLQTPGAGF